MNIDATKLEIMQLLLQTQKVSLLQKIKSVFEEEQGDWWNEMSVEEIEEIKISLEQADREDYISNEDALKRFEKWH